MFKPQKVIFEKGALDYELGKELYKRFKNENKEIIELAYNKISSAIEGETIYEKYRSGKKMLVVGVKRSLKFQACKPSAHYQLPLVSGCMGACEYCYLNTQLGNKPYVRIFVNSDEILNQAQSYINKRIPDTTIFEGSANSDPVPLEPYTGLLKKSIEFFGSQRNAKFRFVTKYNNINSLLYANHNQNTQIRFSLNTSKIIKEYEHFTATVSSRIAAAAKLLEQGYPIGFIIAPVFLYDNWKKDYKDLIQMLHSTLPKNIKLPISFEIISHRYTTKAKNIINQVFPETTLPMTDTERTYKYGQFGYGKFVYTKAQLNEIKDFFTAELNIFDNKDIKYII